MDDFSLSFFDLDHDQGGSGLKALTIEGDWSTAVVAQETSLLVHRAAESKIAFHGTEESEGDPEDPNVLTLNQYNKAVTLRFQHADHFRIGLQVTGAQDRIFEFTGGASILCAKSPTGEALPVGQVYVNEHQLKVGHGEVKHDRKWWWMLAMLSMLAALIFALIFIISSLHDTAATVDSESPSYRPPRSWC